MRVLVCVWNSFTLGSIADAIIFNDWVTGYFARKATLLLLTPYTGVSIHMTLGYTLAFGGVCTLFIIVGGLFFHERNVKWLIPPGVAGLLGLLLLYAVEIFYTRS